ncbi:hypothetical protein DPMN_099000, partial [Dreissena polymorpha]
DRLYITSRYRQQKLLTLARDGTLLATYTDPAPDSLSGLHVTPAGQALVCGNRPNTVLQVGWEGESKLANLATQKDGVWYPQSVCYSSSTSSIIVGQLGDNILNKDAKDVVDKDDLNTQKHQSGPHKPQLLPFDFQLQRMGQVLQTQGLIAEVMATCTCKLTTGILLDSRNFTDSPGLSSQKGSTYFVVNTQSIHGHASGGKFDQQLKQDAKGEPIRPGIESALEKALKNDSSFVLWSSMPFGSQPDLQFNFHHDESLEVKQSDPQIEQALSDSPLKVTDLHMLLSNNMNLTPEEQRCPTFPVQGGDFGVKTHTISGYGSSSNKNRKYFSCAL